MGGGGRSGWFGGGKTARVQRRVRRTGGSRWFGLGGWRGDGCLKWGKVQGGQARHRSVPSPHHRTPSQEVLQSGEGGGGQLPPVSHPPPLDGPFKCCWVEWGDIFQLRSDHCVVVFPK